MTRPSLTHPRRRLSREAGFTLVELLVTLVIGAILVTVALAAVRGVRDRAETSVAKANTRRIVPAIEAYYADNRGYAGMTLELLRSSYDQAIEPANYRLGTVTAATYCVESSHAGETWRKNGPSRPIEPAPCP